MHQPEFILVTGPNASGKTTFIEKNRPELEKNGFDIIIPDNILKKSHSLNEGDPINETIYASLKNHKSLVLESPFQRDSLVDITSDVIYKGYKASLIQLLAGSAYNSLIRAEKRQKRGGLRILPERNQNQLCSKYEKRC